MSQSTASGPKTGYLNRARDVGIYAAHTDWSSSTGGIVPAVVPLKEEDAHVAVATTIASGYIDRSIKLGTNQDSFSNHVNSTL